MGKSNTWFCTVVVLLTSSLALGANVPKTGGRTTPKPATAPKPVTMEAPEVKTEGQVLARVNDSVITLEEFNRKTAGFMGPQHAKGPDANAKEQMLERWMEMELVYQEALQRGMDKQGEVLERLAEARKQILAQALMMDIMQSIAVTDDEAKEYFDAHPDFFKKPESYRISHIELNSEDEATAVKNELDGGASFEDTAKAKSADARTKDNGGDLGSMDARRIALRFGPAAQKAIAELSAGGISAPVKDKRNKSHIIKLVEKTAEAQETFEAAKERAKGMAVREKQMGVQKDLIETLKKNANIEKHTELLGTSAEAEEPAAPPVVPAP